MTKEIKEYINYSTKLQEALIFLLERREALNKFELDLVLDRAQGFSAFGEKAKLTIKQDEVLMTLYNKIRIIELLKAHSEVV